MDPLHPILPVPVNIPPVSEPQRVGRIKRDDQGKGGREQASGRRRRPHQRAEDADSRYEPGYPDSDEPRSHIDITA